MTLKGYITEILSLQKKRDYASAYNILQDALSSYPSNEFLQTSEIFLLLKLKRIGEARQKASSRLQKLKTNPFFLRTYIEILFKEKDKEEILRISDWLKSFFLKDEDLYIYLSRILIKIGQSQRAKELLNTALSFMPESSSLKEFLEGLDKSSIMEGLDYYRKRYEGISPEEAIQEIENILILPDLRGDIPIRLFLAELYKKIKDLKRAEEVYRDCIKIEDSPYIRKMLGFIYYRMSDLDRAFLYLRDSLLEDPNDYAVYNCIAKIISKRADPEEVEVLVKTGLSRHPGARHLYGLLRKVRRR